MIKKVFLFSIIILFTFCVFAQKCKIKEKKTDDGLTYYTKLTGLLKSGMSEAMAYSFFKTVSSNTAIYFFYLYYNHSLFKGVYVNLDNHLYFNLDNGESLEVKPIINYDFDNYFFHYFISVDQLNQLSSHNCNFVTFECHDKEGAEKSEDWILKVKSQERLIHNANCIIE